MSKALFLDIDGVLNSNFWNGSHQREISDGTLIDKEKITILATLIKRTDAKIILHSGWRMWFSDERKPLRREAQTLVNLFQQKGIALAGVTPDLTTEEIRKAKKFSLVKAKEILAYLEMDKDVTAWVVLDDLELHNAQVAQHQVRTDPAIGLTMEDIEQAERILQK